MMQRIRNKMMKGDGGFTLIELLIVIVILGILAAIVVFAVQGITDRGKKSACKSDFKSVEVAQEAHYAKTNPAAYAADVDALVTAKLLRDKPSTANGYAITTDNTGAVTVTVGAASATNATPCDSL